MTITSIFAIIAMSLLSAGTIWCSANGNDGNKQATHSGKPVFTSHLAHQLLYETLPDLAKAQGLDPHNYLAYSNNKGVTAVFPTIAGMEDTDVLHAIDEKHAVVVQTIRPLGVPGISAQQIVLLSPTGKILDRIQCDINCRYGIVKSVILPKPDADGAQIVICFVGRRNYSAWWHNWHTIVFRGKFWTFGEDEQKANEHSLWNEKGLCRVGIANDKFVVLFPKLETPEIKKAKALRIIYNPEGVDKSTGIVKHLDIADPKQVAEMLADIKIKGIDQGKLRGGQTPMTVGFVMPDGTRSRWTFETPEVLSCIVEPDKAPIPGAGTIHLTSRAFFDAVSKAVSKAEGRHIELLAEKKETDP